MQETNKKKKLNSIGVDISGRDPLDANSKVRIRELPMKQYPSN